MSRWPTFFAVAILGFSSTWVQPLFAQGVGGYSPATPVLSPWLNLYNRQAAPVDNYHAYVQPAMQLQNSLQMQQADIQRNAAGLGSVSDRIMSQSEAMRVGPEPTGMGASFMNHRVYFDTYARNGLGGAMGSGFAPGGAMNRGNYTSPASNTGGFGGMGMGTGMGMGAGMGVPSVPGMNGMGGAF